MSNVPITVKQDDTHYYFEGYKALDNNNYQFQFWWNKETEIWYMNIEGINNDLDRKGVALLPGKDLSKLWGYYDFGELWVIDNSGADENPNFAEMGSRWTLEYTPLADL